MSKMSSEFHCQQKTGWKSNYETRKKNPNNVSVEFWEFEGNIFEVGRENLKFPIFFTIFKSLKFQGRLSEENLIQNAPQLSDGPPGNRTKGALVCSWEFAEFVPKWWDFCWKKNLTKKNSGKLLRFVCFKRLTDCVFSLNSKFSSALILQQWAL